jgi:hypothetical protein
LPYALAWYLDVVTPGWEALVLNDYEAVMPLPYRVKFGVNYIYTPRFVQQLGVFGKQAVSVDSFIKAMPAKFKYIDINLNEANAIDGIANTNTLLSLNSSYNDLVASFADNTKRNIKKAEKAGLQFNQLDNADEVVRLFRANKGKYVAFADDDYKLFGELIKAAKVNNAVAVYGVTDTSNRVCAGAVFLSAMGRHIFLFSGNNADARQDGAMHYLIAEFIKMHANTNTVLDFEGSNNANLVRFYLSFGGYATTYPKLKINKLPFPLNKLKS